MGPLERSALPADVAAAIAKQRTLDEVLRWSFARRPTVELVEIVVQDEFTHDAVFRFDERLYLVYDTT